MLTIDVEEISTKLKQLEESSKDIIIEKRPFSFSTFTGKCSAVDSGLFEYKGIGFYGLFIRTIGVLFEYSNGKLGNVSYIPSQMGKQRFEILYGEEEKFYEAKNEMRLRDEIGMVERLISLSNVVFIDGPLHYVGKQSSEMESLFNSIVEKANEQNTLIVGVIKDYRAKHIGGNEPDMLIAQRLLSDKEYIQVKLDSTTIVYANISPHDSPLIIEVPFKDDKKILKAVETVASIAYVSDAFSYPPPLIEADMRAKLKPHERQTIKDIIESAMPHKKLRRYSMPFRF